MSVAAINLATTLAQSKQARRAERAANIKQRLMLREVFRTIYVETNYEWTQTRCHTIYTNTK